MDLVLELIGWAVCGFFEGIAGLLWPSKDATVRRLQRMCLATLVLGLACLGAAVAAAFIAKAWSAFALLLAVTVVCFIGCGVVGNKIERICKFDCSNRK